MTAISKSPLKILCHKLNRRCEGVATVSNSILTATAHCCKTAMLLCRTVLMSSRETLSICSSMKVLLLNQKSAAVFQVHTILHLHVVL